MPKSKDIPLADLVAPGLTVPLRGKNVPCHPMDGFGYQLVNGMTKENSVSVMYRVAARCLGGAMTREQVFGTEDVLGLTAEEVGRVVQVASGQIEAVDATSKNAGKAGNAKDGTDSPSSSPESPLLTLSAS